MQYQTKRIIILLAALYAIKFTTIAQTEATIEQTPCDSVAAKPVSLEEATQQLNEIVVTAKKVVLRNKGMNYTISNIKGSYIGNAGNLMDMLSWTPGISVTNNETISVLGRGENPLIYVNGVKIMDTSELYSLTSSNVSKIEIIREPGADYPVGTSSVILITTVKPISEMINGEVTENAIIRRAFNNKLRATTYGRIKRVSFNASLAYEENRSRQSADYNLDVVTDTPANDYSQTFAQSTRFGNRSLLWFVGANYVAKNKSTYLLQYSGTYGDNDNRYNTYRTISSLLSTQSEEYSTTTNDAPQKHNLLGSGTVKISGGTLKLVATYNHLNNFTKDKYVVSDLAQLHSSDYRYKYDMVTFQGDYSHKLSSLGKHSFGFYLGYSDNFMNLDYSTKSGSQIVTGSNKWAELYYSMNVELGKWSVAGGVRGRYEYDTSKENDADKNTLTCRNLSPKASVSYSLSDDYTLSASYALFYDLPTFRQINPALRLSNYIFYSQGNPDLKQAYTNRFNVTANLKRFTLMSEYYDCHNTIFNVTEPYVDGTFLRHPENMLHTSDFLLAAEYTAMPTSQIRVYGRVMGVSSHLQYYYNSELLKTNDYSMEMNVNAAYRVGAFSFFVTGRYDTPQKVDTRRLSYRLALNVGADCTLMRNKLYIRVEGQDLFNRSVTPSWSEYSPMLYQHRVNRYDTRGLSVSLRYKFTSAKTGFKQASNAADASRLE